jgi:PKD repeat protein
VVHPSRFFTLAALLLFLLAQPGWVRAQQDGAPLEIQLKLGSKKAVVNGAAVELAAEPAAVDGVTMVPLRFLAEAFGLKVSWDAGTGEISLTGETPVAMRAGSRQALVGGKAVALPAPPLVRDGVTLVPLRFLAETLYCQVEYRQATKEIVVCRKKRLPVAVIVLEKDRVVMEEKIVYSSASFSPEGLAIVEERWINPPPWPAPGRYTLGLQVRDSLGRWSLPAEVVVEVLPPPNRPPVARFQVTKSVVAQGERVDYADDSFDPDGDAIVERVWTNRREVFFAPGRHTVTLRVKDSRGLWSEPYSVTITVTEQRLMDEFTYNLRYSLPGEKFSAPLGRLEEAAPAAFAESAEGPVLLLSNSPEKVTRPGVLYRDTVEGQARVFYWHVNATESPVRFLLVAENASASPMRLKVLKEGVAGPEKDAYGLAQKALLRYAASEGGGEVALAPGERFILNWRQHRPAGPGELVHSTVASFPNQCYT